MSTAEMTVNKGVNRVWKELASRKHYGLSPKTQGELAAMLGITRQAINQWTKIPPEYVMDISEALGIPPEEIRPDIFGSKVQRTHIRKAKAAKKDGLK